MMKDKPYNSGKWTDASFRSFIKGGLRQMSYRWHHKHEVKKEAWVKRGVYRCKGWKRRWHHVPLTTLVDLKLKVPNKSIKKRVNNVFIDHIEPVIDPKEGFVGWNEIIERMFCEAEALQVLCRECHTAKTKDERDGAKNSKT